MGVDYRSKPTQIGNRQIKLQLWDTSGQERFRTITSGYYKRAKAVLILYDCGDKESFTNLDRWFR